MLDTAKALLCGAPETAAAAIRTEAANLNAHQAYEGRVRAEHAKRPAAG